MGYTQTSSLNQAAYEMLRGEPIDEAYNEKERETNRSMSKMCGHHSEMCMRHRNMIEAGGKDKELAKHDLAMISHQTAHGHYNKMMYDKPADYYHDKDFYDKMGDMLTKRANGKSKELGVSTDTEK